MMIPQLSPHVGQIMASFFTSFYLSLLCDEFRAYVPGADDQSDAPLTVGSARRSLNCVGRSIHPLNTLGAAWAAVRGDPPELLRLVIRDDAISHMRFLSRDHETKV